MAHPTLRWFNADHLPPNLQAVVGKFATLAQMMDAGLPDSAEKSVALRKLLESKDAAVRATIEAAEKK